MKTSFLAKLNSLVFLNLSVSCILVVSACKQASYQVLQPQSEAVTPPGFDSKGTIPPTARLEVVDQGALVTWTYVGQKVTFRPSKDTVDADYLTKSTCDNPGIQAAFYEVQTSPKGEKTRNDCSSLELSDQSFDKAGEYLIQLKVRSEDQEFAYASMTLKVVEKGTPRDAIEGGFTVYAKPMIVNVNQDIAFTGICELKGQLNVSWDFADKAIGEGLVVSHRYGQTGQYRVSAVCKSSSGKSLQASLTIVVVTSGAPTLPETEITTPSKNPNIPAPTKPDCDPTQGPCKGSTSQTPSQTSKVPTQSPTKKEVIWYYDPYCGCYYHY